MNHRPAGDVFSNAAQRRLWSYVFFVVSHASEGLHA
jgi:hypothetical protein